MFEILNGRQETNFHICFAFIIKCYIYFRLFHIFILIQLMNPSFFFLLIGTIHLYKQLKKLKYLKKWNLFQLRSSKMMDKKNVFIYINK